MEIYDAAIPHFKPLVMMVEDRKQTSEYQIKEFENRGCSVISVSNADDALKYYMGLPKLDLIFADIDLKNVAAKIDKSGVDIAKFIKQLDNELPIIGYSSKFEDDDLTDEEKSYFDGWYPKGGMDITELDEMFDELQTLATTQKKRRYEEFKSIFEGLLAKELIQKEDFDEVLEIAVAIGSNPLSQLNDGLNNSNIELLILRPGNQNLFKRPFLVWLNSNEGIYEIEVYGHSELYIYGEDRNKAINNLIYIMKGYYEDFESEHESSFAGPALKIKKFLKYLFE